MSICLYLCVLLFLSSWFFDSLVMRVESPKHRSTIHYALFLGLVALFIFDLWRTTREATEIHSISSIAGGLSFALVTILVVLLILLLMHRFSKRRIQW